MLHAVLSNLQDLSNQCFSIKLAFICTKGESWVKYFFIKAKIIPVSVRFSINHKEFHNLSE